MATIISAEPSRARPKGEERFLARARNPSAPSRMALVHRQMPATTMAVGVPFRNMAPETKPTQIDRNVTMLGVIGVR